MKNMIVGREVAVRFGATWFPGVIVGRSSDSVLVRVGGVGVEKVSLHRSVWKRDIRVRKTQDIAWLSTLNAKEAARISA